MGANQNTVLRAVLNCGTDDLRILDDIGYDLGKIVDDLLSSGIQPTLNAITQEVFRKGIEEMSQYVTDHICWLEAIPNERDLDEDEEAELADLQKLDPQKDIGWYCNCMDTRIYFKENEEIYKKYLAVEIEYVEDNIGFSFS